MAEQAKAEAAVESKAAEGKPEASKPEEKATGHPATLSWDEAVENAEALVKKRTSKLQAQIADHKKELEELRGLKEIAELSPDERNFAKKFDAMKQAMVESIPNLSPLAKRLLLKAKTPDEFTDTLTEAREEGDAATLEQVAAERAKRNGNGARRSAAEEQTVTPVGPATRTQQTVQEYVDGLSPREFENQWAARKRAATANR